MATEPGQQEPQIKSHTGWALPILRALEALGSTAAPRVVEDKVRELLRGQINDLQWARVVKGNHVRWARYSLKQAGLVGGERGKWLLTDAGHAYLAKHEGEPLVVSWTIEELAAEEAGKLDAPVEVVEVTDYDVYEVPVLKHLAKGTRSKQELMEALEDELEDELLPGDWRIMERGRPVWHYRASWALSNLKKKAEIKNPTPGRWEITDAGKVRLTRDEATWRAEDFRGSKATVRKEAAGAQSASPASSAPPPAPWPTEEWRAFANKYPDLSAAVAQRLRPDLGPLSPLPRNLILYGPPGTGKTYLAKQLAIALTGDEEPGEDDSAWRIVQFHPSYAYEDFIQGLRPDPESKELRYRLREGPFTRLCRTAENARDQIHVLIIDEINRGDPARIFGELLYALEYRGEDVELALGGALNVPSNLVLIGTMNSVDRSVALVDYALRRRFAFVRVDPEPALLQHAQHSTLLRRFNRWLAEQLDAEHVIGHSVFMHPSLAGMSAEDAAHRIWSQDVRPLLEEYFFGEKERLKQAEQEWKAATADAPSA